MKKSDRIMKVATGSFIAGILLVVGSINKNIFVGADAQTTEFITNIIIGGLIVGVVLIIVSVILFMAASGNYYKGN